MPALIRKGGRSNYPYAVARIQAKRAKLIPQRDYEKILKMDVSEITRFIHESAYRKEVEDLGARFHGLDLLEAALAVNEERTYATVRGLLGGEGGALLDMFLQRFLVEDIKTILRGKNAKASREEMLKQLLLEDIDTYEVLQPLLADDVQTAEEVAAGLERAGGVGRDWAKVLRSVGPDAGLSALEDALDKAHFGRLAGSLKASKQKGSQEFLESVRREIDARNLVNAARWVHAGQKGDFAPYVIPDGKHLGVAAVLALSKADSLGALAEQLGDGPLAAAAREAADAAARSGRLTSFQRVVERRLVEDLARLTHKHPLSILPILVYVIQKHREVVTLRAVARGKAAGLSEERLRELVQ